MQPERMVFKPYNTDTLMPSAYGLYGRLGGESEIRTHAAEYCTGGLVDRSLEPLGHLSIKRQDCQSPDYRPTLFHISPILLCS